MKLIQKMLSTRMAYPVVQFEVHTLEHSLTHSPQKTGRPVQQDTRKKSTGLEIQEAVSMVKVSTTAKHDQCVIIFYMTDGPHQVSRKACELIPAEILRPAFGGHSAQKLWTPLQAQRHSEALL